MKSPFPGMDPYLETGWEDVHHRLTQYACDTLQLSLPDDLWARVEERVFVETDAERKRHIVPDTFVSRVYPRPEPQPTELKEGGLAIAEPVVFDLHDLDITEGYIAIIDRHGGGVVTVIEFLSPTNKTGGAGQEKYLEKQAEVLRSNASLVEIDLVRAGRSMLALPHYEIPIQHRGDYLACISPGWKRNRRELYPMPLRQRLPILPIPLRKQESAVPLDLQELVDQAYTTGRYDRLDYGVELDPPLSVDNAAWAETLLKAAGKR
ncbi:MAG: DUF4058 family protein [Verrucomicrobiota bacterium]